MILQVQDVLKDAMSLIGVIAIDETPSASEMQIALRTANIMIDRWSSQRLLLRSTIGFDVVLTANKAVYTIGPAFADFTFPKPLKITSAYYRLNNVDTPVDVITPETYNNLMDKTISTGPVLYISYDPGQAQQAVNVGTLSVYLCPDQAYPLHFEADIYLNEFTALTTTVTFEPAYYEALVYNLAERLFRHYNSPKASIPMDIVGIAHESLNNLKAMNSVSITASMDIPGKAGKYNIYTDGFA